VHFYMYRSLFCFVFQTHSGLLLMDPNSFPGGERENQKKVGEKERDIFKCCLVCLLLL
jgi:hypothetical protein